MITTNKTNTSIQRILLFIASVLIFSACSRGTRLLNKIPINSMNVRVVDSNENPINGAQVEASNGRESSTNNKGIAKVRFGSVGIHIVSVYADNYMPSNFLVTMPTDRGKTITRRMAGEINFTGLNFRAMNMYPLIFNYMFSSYGYDPQFEQYKEGESTTWDISSSENGDETLTMSKAYLKKMDNGKQWWSIKLTKPGENQSNYTAEILFSKDRTKILRYREKLGDNEVQEKPVSDGWYTQPVSLTEESQQGALKEQHVSLEIPKGTFKADKLQFGVAPGTNLTIWRANDSPVPGGALQYEIRSNDTIVFRNKLRDYGTEARTMLESY